MKKIIIFLLFALVCNRSFAQKWTQVTNGYSGCGAHDGAAFSIGDTCYFVGGDCTQSWAFDTLTQAWTSIAPYPGSYANGAFVGFSLNGMGYVGTGVGGGDTWDSTMWQYNPATNQWTKLAHFPGEPRGYAVGFNLDGRLFIGCGIGNNVGAVGLPLNDFYEYNPATNIWTQIASYLGAGNQSEISFVVGDKAYVGGGVTISSGGANLATNDDFWEYDTTSKVWTQIANFGGGNRVAATGLSTCDKGYVGLGYSDVSQNTAYNDFWEYDPGSNTWIQIGNFGGTARRFANGFTIGKSFFVGLGTDASNNTQNDVWELIRSFTPAFSADTSICSGGSLTFTDTSNYSPTNWYWQFPGGKPDISTVQIPTIEYDSAGIFSVTLTAWNGCDSGTLTFTNYVKVGAGGVLTVLPQSPKVCSGGNVTLSVTNRGTGFTWTPSSGLIDSTASGDSVVAAPAITTVYTIMGASAGGCTAIGTDTVIVDTAPPLTVSPQPPPSFCSGSNAELKVSGGGTNFIWTPSTGLSATTGDSVLASPTVTTTYAVTGKDTLGCPSSGTEKVTVFPAPIIPTVTQSGNILKSSAQYQNQWYLNDTLLVGDTSQYLTITTGGEYRVSVTNEANGCSSASDSANITTGINQLSVISDQLSIYPNPTGGEIFININSSAEGIKDWNLEITDVLGRIVYARLSLNYSNAIDLSNLASGVYFITVINKTGRAVFPVIRQNY